MHCWFYVLQVLKWKTWIIDKFAYGLVILYELYSLMAKTRYASSVLNG